MQTNQYHYQNRVTLREYPCVCVCTFLWIHLYFNFDSLSHSPLAMFTIFVLLLLCGNLFLRHTHTVSTFILVVVFFSSFFFCFQSLCQWCKLSYFTFCEDFFLSFSIENGKSLSIGNRMCMSVLKCMETFSLIN